MTMTVGRLLTLLVALLLTACAMPGQQQAAPPPPLPTNTPTPVGPAGGETGGAGGTWQEVAALDRAYRLRSPHDRVALARALGGKPDTPRVARTVPLEVQTGNLEPFWVNNIARNENYVITAELRYAGPLVLMYVEQGMVIAQEDLEQAARTFEQEIIPRTREVFGSEWQPGVDGDPRITILNTQQQGDSAIGYFSSRDSTPREANRFSNEREMFYMKIAPGHPAYLSVLAHEFQHMVHWNEQRRSQTWFNEGCSTLNEDLNGYPDTPFIAAYLARPETQLNTWGATPGGSTAHYGAANLFLRYIYRQYVGSEDSAGNTDSDSLVPLLRADASNNLSAFVEMAQTRHPDITSFGMLAGTWAVANLLNNPALADGRYSYAPGVESGGDEQVGGEMSAIQAFPSLPHTVTPRPIPFDGMQGDVSGTLPQFGAAYLELPPGPLHLTFSGSITVSLVGARPYDTYAWWSGRGDNVVATLTRRLDLRDPALNTPELRFLLWYDLEQDYDYAFVSVSVDGGETWETLPGTHTTTSDPQGANYGHGLNGASGAGGAGPRWVEEMMDLSPYAEQQIMLRFWLINDEGINEPGLLLDNIRVCQTGRPDVCLFQDDMENGKNQWQAAGFVRVDSDLPQRWEVRLVRFAPDGESGEGDGRESSPPVSVERLVPNPDGTTTATLGGGERGVLVMLPTTPHTTERGSYSLVVVGGM